MKNHFLYQKNPKKKKKKKSFIVEINGFSKKKGDKEGELWFFAFNPFRHMHVYDHTVLYFNPFLLFNDNLILARLLLLLFTIKNNVNYLNKIQIKWIIT